MHSSVTPLVTEMYPVNVTGSPRAIVNGSDLYYDNYNPGTPFDIAMDCLLILAMITALCLLVSLCWYEVLLRRSGDASALTGETKFRIAPWLRILCILSALFNLLRCVNDIMYYKTSTMGSERCTVLKNIGVSWLVGVDTTVYLFLWLRQRVLYSKRSMKHLENKLTFFSSWLALVLIVLIFLGMNALLGWRKYTYDPVKFKCKSVKNFVTSAIPTTWAISSSFLHVILAALYIYPLVRQTARLNQKRRSSNFAAPGRLASLIQRKRGPDTPEGDRRNNIAPSSGKRSLMDVVVRCVIISLVCVFTDGFTIMITRFVITAPQHTKLRHFIYNINTIINVFAIVSSFRKWDAMMFPCRRFPRNPDTRTPKRIFADAAQHDSGEPSLNAIATDSNFV